VAEGGEELEHGGGDGLFGGVSGVQGGFARELWGGGGHTRRAGVRVPSTSKRQMVFLTGRSANGG